MATPHPRAPSAGLVTPGLGPAALGMRRAPQVAARHKGGATRPLASTGAPGADPAVAELVSGQRRRGRDRPALEVPAAGAAGRSER